jgi:flavin reductase (DIM6/NTAB) family NADH-FMN oxidoreductase RutF
MIRIRNFNKFFRLDFCEPLALVTSHYEGKSNVLTVGWTTLAALNPFSMAITIAKARYSHNIIKNSNEFVIAYPDVSMEEIVSYCGSVSGRYEDKISKLANTPAIYVKAPLLIYCILNIECQVTGSLDVGSHTLFVGRVQAMHRGEGHKRLYHFGGGQYRTC